jgi:hypothetical protein
VAISDIADFVVSAGSDTTTITDAITAATSTIDTYTNTTAEQVVVLLSDYIDASALSVDSGISREEGIWMVNNFTNTTGEQVVSDLTEIYAGVTESVVEAIDIARGLINTFTNETAETLSARMVVKVDALDGVVDAGVITITDAITATEGVLSGEHADLTTYVNTTGEVVLTNMTDSLGELASSIADLFISMAGNTNDATADIKSDIADLDIVVDAGIITITDAITATEGVLSGEHADLTTYINTTGNQIVSLVNAATSDYASATDTYINESLEVVLTNLTEQLASPIIIDIDALQSSLGTPADANLPSGLPYETSRDDCTWDVVAEVSRCFKCSTVGSVKTCRYCEHYVNEAFTWAQCIADSGEDSQAYGQCAMTIGTSSPIDLTLPFTSDEVAFV